MNEIEPTDVRPLTFLDLMLRLHRDLFADLPGELFLGFMGLVFVVAVVSGGVLYAPFARRQKFGELRGASRRLWWLDLHNMLGVVTIAWAVVVGATGVMNELSRPLFAVWQRTDVAEMLKPYRGQSVPEAASFSSVQAAFDLAAKTLPDRRSDQRGVSQRADRQPASLSGLDQGQCGAHRAAVHAGAGRRGERRAHHVSWRCRGTSARCRSRGPCISAITAGCR